MNTQKDQPNSRTDPKDTTSQGLQMADEHQVILLYLRNLCNISYILRTFCMVHPRRHIGKMSIRERWTDDRGSALVNGGP